MLPLKKEIVIAGIVILVLGTLFFALSQESRVGQAQTLTLAYDKQIYSQYASPCSATAPLQGYANYKFNVSCVGTGNYAGSDTSIASVNITDPQGSIVTYASDNAYDSWGYVGNMGSFTSNQAGNYVFNLAGFNGNPNITLSVYQVGSTNQTTYPFDYMVYLAVVFWVIGLILALLGIAWKVRWNDNFHFPPPPPKST